MKVQYTTQNGRLTAEFEADTQVELFKQLAQFQEVFENTTCSDGKESSDVVRFSVREVEGNHFFELVCVDESKPNLRWAKKKYGQHKGKDQTLFPKADWAKWNPQTEKEEPLNQKAKTRSSNTENEFAPV